MRSAVHNRSFSGSGSVKGIIDLLKNSYLGVAKHLICSGVGGGGYK